MLIAEIVTVAGYLRKDYRTIVGAVLSIVSGKGQLPPVYNVRHSCRHRWKSAVSKLARFCVQK